MLDYLDTDRCRMWFLRDQLDDPEAAECGRCDNCGGLGLSADVSAAAVEEAGARLVAPGVVIEPRKMWPSALANLGVDLKGKIADGAGEGRAVARLTDLGYGQALRELFRPGQPDGPVPVPLVRAVVEVLGDWRPRRRRHRRGGVRDPAHADRRPRGRAVALPEGAGPGAVRDRRPHGRARAGGDELRPAGGRGRPPVPAGRRRARRTPRSSSSTTWWSPAGPSRWPPGRCAGRGPTPSSRWRWRCRPEPTSSAISPRGVAAEPYRPDVGSHWGGPCSLGGAVMIRPRHAGVALLASALVLTGGAASAAQKTTKDKPATPPRPRTSPASS